jgi:hypothetical protein
MLKIDNKTIELFDKLTTVLQKRGWLPLNTLIMGTECLFWTLLVVGTTGTFLIAMAAFAALSLATAFYNWKEANGYWENHRKTQQLNAVVVLHREQWKWRLFAACFFLPLLVFEVITFAWNPFGTGILVLFLGYLRCCKYLGPGKFAREKKVNLQGLPQEG